MAALIGIDLELDGKQSGHLAIPHSTHVSAYGKIIVPVAYIRNGDGSRALLTAGVHGDEFEGQIALRNLALELMPVDIEGSLLIVPMANAPAVLSSARVSPIDHMNLNRAFPGNPLGSPTAVIASAIEDHLLEGCGFAYDIHSGGSSLMYKTVALTTASGCPRDDRRRLDLIRALGVEAGMLLPSQSNMGLESSLDGAMLRKNVIGASAEFGGGGMLCSEMLGRCERSIRAFLAYTGLTPAASVPPADRRCQIFDVSDPDAYVFARAHGIFRASAAIGSIVAKGDVIGCIYDFYDLTAPPEPIRSEASGTILALRALPRVQPGDCLAQVGKPSRDNEGTMDAD